jgi:hypothetical protein
LADINPELVIGSGGNQPARDPPQQQMVQSEIVLNDSDVRTAYSNFARVTATPEEVILDFALNPNPFAQGRHEVKVTERVVLNYFTAKRLCRALVATLQHMEASFGNIELDVQRRLQGTPPGGPMSRQ